MSFLSQLYSCFGRYSRYRKVHLLFSTSVLGAVIGFFLSPQLSPPRYVSAIPVVIPSSSMTSSMSRDLSLQFRGAVKTRAFAETLYHNLMEVEEYAEPMRKNGLDLDTFVQQVSTDFPWSVLRLVKTDGQGEYDLLVSLPFDGLSNKLGQPLLNVINISLMAYYQKLRGDVVLNIENLLKEEKSFEDMLNGQKIYQSHKQFWKDNVRQLIVYSDLLGIEPRLGDIEKKHLELDVPSPDIWQQFEDHIFATMSAVEHGDVAKIGHRSRADVIADLMNISLAINQAQIFAQTYQDEASQFHKAVFQIMRVFSEGYLPPFQLDTKLFEARLAAKNVEKRHGKMIASICIGTALGFLLGYIFLNFYPFRPSESCRNEHEYKA